MKHLNQKSVSMYRGSYSGLTYLFTTVMFAHSNKIIRFQVYDYDGNLTVRIDESSIGKYICRASVKGFREISASAEVLMKGNSFFTL